MAVERGKEEVQTLEGTAIIRSGETASTAAAESAKAMVQARFLVALNRPRNFDQARQRLLAACMRPRFAATARYAKPMAGGQVEGMSIRFADEAVKLLGNIDTRQEVLYEDDDQRIVQVTVTDLESNLSKMDTVCIKKTVERKAVKKGQDVIGHRENSNGQKVYIIRATDDELVTKEANLCAKKRRNLELQLIPQDLIEECEERVKETLRDQYAKDPDGSRKAILDAFAAIGVMPEQLQEYLGHSTQTITPAEFDMLKKLGAALRDNHTTWAEVMDAKSGDKGQPERASVNIDDIKAGDPASHTPVDAPVRPGSILGHGDVKRRDGAYEAINARFDVEPDVVDMLLADIGLPSFLDVDKKTCDLDVIKRLESVAKMIAARK